jgi:hypothetical protein
LQEEKKAMKKKLKKQAIAAKKKVKLKNDFVAASGLDEQGDDENTCQEQEEGDESNWRGREDIVV